MTTTGAYKAGLACKNTACKSHGSPHPNCRCYPGMAEGGDVERYCDKDQPHRRDCKYFAEGGAVNALDIPQHEDPEQAVSGYLTSGGLHGLLKPEPTRPQDAIDRYNQGVRRGDKHLDTGVESLFGGKRPEDRDHSASKKAIDEWISKGGINSDIKDEHYKNMGAPQLFAKGGMAKSDGGLLNQQTVASVYPAHSAMMQEAKGRMSNYLSSLRPQKGAPTLAFDTEPEDPVKKKSYESALQTAAHPARILDEIHKGTITPEHVEQFKNLYPELSQVMQKKLTTRIVEAQLKGEKPSHKVRQGLSLFLGAPLSGEFLPQNIQAAQAVFQNQGAQKQQEGQMAPKKTSALGKSSQSYLLPNQAAAGRQQKQ